MIFENSEYLDAATNYQPYLFKNTGYKSFEWQKVFDVLDTSLEKDPDSVKLMRVFGYITHKYWEQVEEINDVMKDVKAAYPGFLHTANIYTALTSKTIGFGKHVDHMEIFFWQVIGKTKWSVFVTHDNPKVFVLEPGDILYVPSSMPHEVVSLTPRVGVSISVENIR